MDKVINLVDRFHDMVLEQVLNIECELRQREWGQQLRLLVI